MPLMQNSKNPLRVHFWVVGDDVPEFLVRPPEKDGLTHNTIPQYIPFRHPYAAEDHGFVQPVWTPASS